MSTPQLDFWLFMMIKWNCVPSIFRHTVHWFCQTVSYLFRFYTFEIIHTKNIHVYAVRTHLTFYVEISVIDALKYLTILFSIIVPFFLTKFPLFLNDFRAHFQLDEKYSWFIWFFYIFHDMFVCEVGFTLNSWVDTSKAININL